MKTSILGVSFDNISPADACAAAISFLQAETPRIIFTPNPEMVMHARKDAEFRRVLNSADLVIPDGIGIVYASRLTSSRISRRVPGIELVADIFAHIKDTGNSVYLLGAAPGVADAAAVRLAEQFPGLNIVGTRHGYFADADDDAIITAINAANPDILLVGLGFPRQEKWIYHHKNHLDTKLLIGVGGSLDGLSGRIRRAPEIFQKLGLEWFYRLIRQPKRIWRQRVLAKFVLIVLYKKLRGEL